MKKIIFAALLLGYGQLLYSQNQAIIDEIKALEQSEVKAVLRKDTAMLLKLWDKAFVVNSPESRVVFPGTTTLDRPVLRNDRISFTREVEQVIVKRDVAFSMGSETVVPLGNASATMQPVKRRYTNIWMNTDGSWKLVARHANVICENKN